MNKPVEKLRPVGWRIPTKPLGQPKGYVAFMSLLILMVVASAIGVGAALLAIDEAQLGYAVDKGTQALIAAESCIEEAALRLKRSSAYTGGTLSIGTGSCSMTITGSGGTRTITATGTVQNFTRRLQATVNLSPFSMTSWEELP